MGDSLFLETLLGEGDADLQLDLISFTDYSETGPNISDTASPAGILFRALWSNYTQAPQFELSTPNFNDSATFAPLSGWREL